MKRTDIVMTEELKSFLAFDLGHMKEDAFPNKRTDIPYCDDPELLMDIYYPEEKKDTYPVFLIVFGGGWISGFRRSRFVEYMLKPLQMGYACAVAQYTLSLDDTFPRPVIDLKKAVDYLHTHAQELLLDTDNLTLWGESAGGHLALETALLPNERLGLTGLNTAVKNLVIFYPITDCDTIDRYVKTEKDRHLRPDSVMGIFLSSGLNDPQTLDLASPAHWIHPGMPRLWLQHGTADRLVTPHQSVELAEKMRRKCPDVPFFFELKEGKEHADPYFFSMENVKRFIRFIEE